MLDSNRYGIPHSTIKVSLHDLGFRNPKSLAWAPDALVKQWVQGKFAAIDEVVLIVIFTFK